MRSEPMAEQRLIQITALHQLATAASEGRRLAGTPALVDTLEALAFGEHMAAPADLIALCGLGPGRVSVADIAQTLLSCMRGETPFRREQHAPRHSFLRGQAA
jgi:hypothetical protein